MKKVETRGSVYEVFNNLTISFYLVAMLTSISSFQKCDRPGGSKGSAFAVCNRTMNIWKT